MVRWAAKRGRDERVFPVLYIHLSLFAAPPGSDDAVSTSAVSSGCSGFHPRSPGHRPFELAGRRFAHLDLLFGGVRVQISLGHAAVLSGEVGHIGLELGLRDVGFTDHDDAVRLVGGHDDLVLAQVSVVDPSGQERRQAGCGARNLEDGLATHVIREG